ncbi:MAG: hypothetical protein R2751_03910 [Bacteroidales bacterium]
MKQDPAFAKFPNVCGDVCGDFGPIADRKHARISAEISDLSQLLESNTTKNKRVMMKNLRKGWIRLLALAMVALISCDKDDPDPDPDQRLPTDITLLVAALHLPKQQPTEKMAVTKKEANQTALRLTS